MRIGESMALTAPSTTCFKRLASHSSTLKVWFDVGAYSHSAIPCHLRSRWRIKLKRSLLIIMRISTENSSKVRVSVVLMISAPMNSSRLNVKYPER